MKKIILALLLVLALVSTSEGQRKLGGVQRGGPSGAGDPLRTPTSGGGVSGGTPSTNYCTGSATCTTTTPGQCDVLCDDFEGSSYCVGTSGDQDCRATWTEFGAANSVDWTTTHSGTFACTDKGSYAAQFNFTADTQYGYYKSAAADKALSYVQFYINFTATTVANDHTAGIFFSVDSTSAYAPYIISLYNDGGTYRISLAHSDAATLVHGATTAISVGTNTWYRIRVMYNRTAGTATVKVDDTTEINVASGVTGSTPRFFGIGNVGAFTNGESITFQIDNIAVDDDTEQGACN